jgi:hypothetical protein
MDQYIRSPSCFDRTCQRVVSIDSSCTALLKIRWAFTAMGRRMDLSGHHGSRRRDHPRTLERSEIAITRSPSSGRGRSINEGIPGLQGVVRPRPGDLGFAPPSYRARLYRVAYCNKRRGSWLYVRLPAPADDRRGAGRPVGQRFRCCVPNCTGKWIML